MSAPRPTTYVVRPPRGVSNVAKQHLLKSSAITVHLQAADGTQRTLQGAAGRSLMQVAVDAGVAAIAADCGGCLNCATCHVFVEPDWLPCLPAPTTDELALLEMTAAERESGSRLSCQIVLTPTLAGLRVRLPPTQY